MGIKAVVDTLEGLPEAVAGLYKKDETLGKYVLDAEGVVPKEKLAEFRDNNIRLMKEKTDLEGRYKDVDLDEYVALKTEATKNKNKKLIDEGKIEELVEGRVVEMRTKLTKERDDAIAAKAAAEAHLATVLIDNEIQKEALPLAADTGMEDIVSRGRAVFRLQEGKVLPFEGDRIKYGTDGVTPLSVKEWLQQLAAKAPHLFKQSKGAGASEGQGGGKGFGGSVAKRSDLKNSAEKSAFIAKHGRDAYLKLPA